MITVLIPNDGITYETEEQAIEDWNSGCTFRMINFDGSEEVDKYLTIADKDIWLQNSTAAIIAFKPRQYDAVRLIVISEGPEVEDYSFTLDII